MVRFRFLIVSALMLFIAAVPLPSVAAPLIHGDEATPEAGESASMPVEIHAGSCGHYELDAVVALTDLIPPEAETETDANPSAMSISTIDVSLDDLLAESHVVVVHESSSAIDSVLACGAIGGHPEEDGLAIGLSAVSTDTPVSGVAWLTASGSQTQIAVFLTEQPSLSAAIEVPVTLGGGGNEFAIESDLTTFQEGQLYRFVVTNAGAIPHEFVIGQSLGKLSGGDGEHDDEDMHMDDEEDMHMDEESSSTSADHDLIHETSLALIEADDLPSGATVSVDVVFDEPTDLGSLEFACHVPGHYEAGMFLPFEVMSESAD